eukprot:gene43486-biopygen51904
MQPWVREGGGSGGPAAPIPCSGEWWLGAPVCWRPSRRIVPPGEWWWWWSASAAPTKVGDTAAPTRAPSKRPTMAPTRAPSQDPACGFETAATPYCDIWDDASGDEFDWTRRSGGTPTSSTGPSSAHEGQLDKDFLLYYLFAESSHPRSTGDTATLEALSQNADTLSLWYHMYGSAIGELRVEARSSGGAWATAWSRTGAQGSSWQQAAGNIQYGGGWVVVVGGATRKPRQAARQGKAGKQQVQASECIAMQDDA